jgi:hypothetical protein
VPASVRLPAGIAQSDVGLVDQAHATLRTIVSAQVRQLLTDPSWLEVKLHCYGVAAVVDDFRSFLQVGSCAVLFIHCDMPFSMFMLLPALCLLEKVSA